MTLAVVLDRLPRPITRLLDEAGGNLITVSNHLDELGHQFAGDAARALAEEADDANACRATE